MKFSIRDLFLVTVIVALVLGWWVDHRRLVQTVEPLTKKAKEADELFDSLRSMVEFEDVEVNWERNENGDLSMSILFPALANPPTSQPRAPIPWLLIN